jgi:hypothetical protein
MPDFGGGHEAGSLPPSMKHSLETQKIAREVLPRARRLIAFDLTA